MKISTTCILASVASTASAFSATKPLTASRVPSSLAMQNENSEPIRSFDPLNLSSSESEGDFDIKPAMVSLLALGAFNPSEASAAGPDWGIFEGRTGSLLHPVIMGGTFLLSCSAAVKGFQYRRQRTMGTEISALKSTLPSLNGASTLSAAIADAEAGEDSALAAQLRAAIPIQNEIDALVAERKELSSKNLRDSHFSQGALLAFLGTAFAIEVCNHYKVFRTKL